MANAEYSSDSRNVSGTSHGYNHRIESHSLSLFLYHRVVWSQVAHWIYSPEPIHLGPSRSLYSVDSAIVAELHLVRCSVMEWRTTCHVCLSIELVPCAVRDDGLIGVQSLHHGDLALVHKGAKHTRNKRSSNDTTDGRFHSVLGRILSLSLYSP